VHLYTASGGVVGVLALFAAAEGRIREAFFLLIVTMLIDGTDGVLARRARVGEVLPNFSGAEVDNVIDFLNYVWTPVFIMGTQNLLPAILTFIPTRYLYPSKNDILWKTSWTLGGVWFALLIYLLSQENAERGLIWLSLYYPVYYLAVSFYLDWKIRRRH